MHTNKQILEILGRKTELFNQDLEKSDFEIRDKIKESSFLILGAAGSIGKAISKEILERNPRLVHLVDISENNLVSIVRELRSNFLTSKSNFESFCLDIGSQIFSKFLKNKKYDYVLNLSAMKHVRSERDPFTLMRMLKTNIHNSLKVIDDLEDRLPTKYFCVSTDKASNPVSLMGASKRIMEICLFNNKNDIPISMSRFANVAFSDGSLLDGFMHRIQREEPISAPKDIKRYFITPKESGLLCLFSSILGKQNQIFFPNDPREMNLLNFDQIAKNLIEKIGFIPHECESEREAVYEAKKLIHSGKWPCYFFESDTSGEKSFEEFYTEKEEIDLTKFSQIGIVNSKFTKNKDELKNFFQEIELIENKNSWNMEDLVSIFSNFLPEFKHLARDSNLDQKL
jgi:FlaA1/EpsC-like NDP-sugar epimerase